MKWIDYREKLGIGFDDVTKLQMFKNKISNYLNLMQGKYDEREFWLYCTRVGERSFTSIYDLVYSFCYEPSISAVISKIIAFCNDGERHGSEYKKDGSVDYKYYLLEFVEKALSELNIPFDIVEDDDGVFIFPKGAKELDDALVSEPLEWLNDYPNGRKAFVKALKDYSEMKDGEASSVADNLRKALEAFFQEFFGGSKSLENYKSDYGTYLKDRGVPKEISNNFETLLKSYTDYNNSYAKHHDKSEKNVLEYLLYQTGNIIRLLITLKQGGTQNAD